MVTQQNKHPFSQRRVRTLVVSIGAALVISAAGLYVAVDVWPALGALGSEILRDVMGNDAVTSLENLTFQIQDQLRRWEYELGGAQPAAPWAVATPIAPGHATPIATGGKTPPDTPVPPQQSNEWKLAPLAPHGSLAGEGQWSAYIQNDAGQTVGYRTFLQPDPKRPYATVAIVALDLHAVELRFVLGSVEPTSTVKIDRPGRIPDSDLMPGKLLAAFNGGFKAVNGQFGVMVGQTTVLPLKNGLGTVAIYPNGQVRIGEWGTDITDTAGVIAVRQNCPLIVHDGETNPLTENPSPVDWGYTVNGATATARSALAISADRRVLYYAAGDNLVLPVLAQALADTGVEQAMQLDINPFWVHFEAYRKDGNNLLAEMLLGSMGKNGSERYLKSFTRDFFYIIGR